MSEFPRPYLGYGVGLRRPHYGYILERWPKVDWFEVISENFLVPGGRPLSILDRVRSNYPVVLHGVSLSIGSADPLNESYVRRLRELATRIQPAWISDHLCWTGIGGHNLHDLLPLPYTEEALRHVAARVRRVQDLLGCRIALENPSTYLSYRHSTMPEWEFLAAVAEAADCLILLDINNVYVSAFNHGFDPHAYLNGIPPDRVIQFHLAGHSDHGRYLLDTHDHPIIDPVWALYAEAVRRFGQVSTLIERDDNIPEFPELAAEAEKARTIAETTHALGDRTRQGPAPVASADCRA